MKAYTLHGVGDLRYEEAPVPETGPGWALIRVLAAGICSSDIPRIFEKGTYHFPTVPGHEFCGVVERVNGDESWVGKRVGVYPLIPCGRCGPCLKGEFETCRGYDYIGSRRDGAFGEFAAAPVRNLIELPGGVSDIGGAMLEPLSVALHAVRRLGGVDKRSVCVLGAGPIGLMAGQWAKAMGARRVVIKGRSEWKRALAEGAGLEYTTGTGGEFDCVIEAVGSEEAVLESVALAGPGGRLVLMGNPAGDMALPRDLYWRILRGQLTVTGTWNSSFWGEDSDWAASARAMAGGSIDPEGLCTHQLGLSELPRGLAIMRDKTEPYGKIIVRGR